MKNVRYEYEKPSVLDIEQLDIELNASTIQTYLRSELRNSNIEVVFSEVLTVSEEESIESIITNHDGHEARTSERLERARYNILSKLTAVAHEHSILSVENPPATGHNAVTKYLTSIDNYFNSWKRDGNHEVLVDKINTDAGNVLHESYQFLNTEVLVGTGITTAQYLISHIPTTPYL